MPILIGGYVRRSSLIAVTATLLFTLAGCTDDEPATDVPAPEEPSTPDDGGGDTGADRASGDGDAAGDDGADGDDGSSSDGSDEASGGSDTDLGGLEFARCEGEDISIDHPTSWTMYEDDVVPPCHVFHPEQITDYVGESLHYAARLSIDPVEFEDATGSEVGEELSRQETTIDGHDAVVIERRSEGEAMLPEGERSYTSLVDLDGRILVATTSSVGETDYERDRAILDRMMDSITIHASG